MFVLKYLFELVDGHGFMRFLDCLSDAPNVVEVVGSVVLRPEGLLSFKGGFGLGG